MEPLQQKTPVEKRIDKEIEELASFIFTEDRAYEYCDVYKFARALLQKAREKWAILLHRYPLLNVL